LPEKGEYVLDKYGYAVVNESILMSPRILLKKISSNTIQTTKRHKYADLIHAWAEGAEIQWKDGDYWKDIEDPGFYEYDEYRIKPKPRLLGLGIGTIPMEECMHHIHNVKKMGLILLSG
jgi:hypothetical protein